MAHLAKFFVQSMVAQASMEAKEDENKKPDDAAAADLEDTGTLDNIDVTEGLGDTAGDKPADDKPADDKPAGDAPAADGDKPAEDKPAEDKPADEPATTDTPPAADEGGAPAGDEPAATTDEPTNGGEPTGEEPPATDEPAEVPPPAPSEGASPDTNTDAAAPDQPVDEVKPADDGAIDPETLEHAGLEVDEVIDNPTDQQIAEALDGGSPAADTEPAPTQGDAADTGDAGAADDASTTADTPAPADTSGTEPPAADSADDVSDMDGDAGYDDDLDAFSEATDLDNGDGDGDADDVIDETDTPLDGSHAVADLANAIDEAREAHEASVELIIVHEGAEETHDTLDTLNQNGGVSAESFPFFEIALTNYAQAVGRTSILLGVSTESFEGEEPGQRFEVSLEDLADLVKATGKAIEPMKAQVASFESRVHELQSKQLSSNLGIESFSQVGVSRQQDAVASRLESRLQDQIKAAVGLENLLEMIESANDNGGLTTDAMVGAELALESITRPMNLPTISLHESLEGLELDTRTVVSTEGIIDAIKTVGGLIADTLRTGARVARNALGMLTGTLPTVIKKLEAFHKKLESAKGETQGTVSVGNAAKRLNRAGEMPPDLSQYLKTYSEFIDKFCTTFTGQANKALSYNAGLYGKVDYLNQESFFHELDQTANQWEDPRKSFSSHELQIEIPGGGRMFGTWDDKRYAGSNEGAKKLDAFVHEYMINGLWVRGKAKVPSLESLPALSVADMKLVTDSMLKTLHAIRPEALAVSDQTIGVVWAMYDRANQKRRKSKAIVRTIKPEIATLDTALWGSAILALDFGWSAAKEFVKIALSFLSYAERSLATIPSASTEGLVASMEADIKDLRPGKKVKYSHGHGKIVKVFTAPFKYKGEAHHASKDSPKFEVKSDKGNKLSLHKASALSLA